MPAIPFASRTLQAFRRANINTMLEIEKLDKQELFASTGDLRNRNAAKHNKTNLVFQHDSVTEKMLAISRHLSETTQKSAITLETLVSSSANVEGTNDELQNTAGNILHSKRLLKKYGRRECTDKILVFFAFTLFVACVLYIVHKRLFWKFNVCMARWINMWLGGRWWAKSEMCLWMKYKLYVNESEPFDGFRDRKESFGISRQWLSQFWIS